MDTFEILLNGLKEIPGLDDGHHRFLYPFNGYIENSQRRFLGIPDDERVVYLCIHSDESSLAITDRAVYRRWIEKFLFITSDDVRNTLPFRLVTKVRYSANIDESGWRSDSLFIFYDAEDNTVSFYESEMSRFLEPEKCTSFAKVLDEAVKSVLSWSDYFQSACALHDNGNYDDALVELQRAIEIGNKDHDFSDDGSELAYIFYVRGLCLAKLNKPQDARTDLLIARDVFTKNSNSTLSMVLCALSLVTDNRIEQHRLLTEAYDKSSDFEEKKNIMEELISLHASSEFKDAFAFRESIAERKVLLAVKNDSQPIPGQTVMCLERSVLHSLGVSFPLGHPVDGVAYVAHPTRSNYYVPMNEYEDIIFLEKVNEYCYLLQCLGAKEIDIARLSGKSLSEMKKSGESGEASLGYKLSEFEGKAENGSQSNSDYSKTSEYKSHLSFSPSREPFVPKDLNWLAIEPRWSRLIDNRLHGNLQHYVEEISTSEDKMLSSSEETEVAAEIKALGARFKGCIKSNDSMSSSSKETTTWQISVKF